MMSSTFMLLACDAAAGQADEHTCLVRVLSWEPKQVQDACRQVPAPSAPEQGVHLPESTLIRSCACMSRAVAALACNTQRLWHGV